MPNNSPVQLSNIYIVYILAFNDKTYYPKIFIGI